jgi:hypothetical protein
MEDSFEIKSPEPQIRFGMTKAQQEEAIRKMKQDNDISTKY